MKQLTFPIIIERDKDGYFVTCPELQGCSTQGDTYEEAVSNIKEAISLYLESMIENKERIPNPESVSITTVQVSL